MKNKFLLFLFLLHCNMVSAQTLVDVMEQTLKIGAKNEEVFYYAFDEGDKIVFSCEVVDGKGLKEVEITEMPENVKFKDYQVERINGKIITVQKKSIFKFRVYNGAALKKSICRVKIQRIPKDAESLAFNTGIKWVEKFDTTYDIKTENVVTGYNTVQKQKSRRVLEAIDTTIVPILTDRIERVHSKTNTNSNISQVTFLLPENTYSPNVFIPYKSTETIAWAYSLAVGETGQAWYKDANAKAAAKKTANLAVSSGLVTTGYGALALLAIEGVSTFSNPPKGDNVRFTLFNGAAQLPYGGNSVAASGKITNSTQGYQTIRLENDNTFDGINVDVEVIAIVVTKRWKDEYYTVEDTNAIKEKKTFKIPKITKVKVPDFID